MRKEQRLRLRKEFAVVYRKGRAQSSHLLVVRVLPNDSQVSRFGFVVGKVVGGAVVRNRVKRRLREAARRLPMRDGFDIVVSARKPAADAGFDALYGALASLAGRAGVLAQESASRETI